MSLPIGDLLQGLQGAMKSKASEGKIGGTDIPEMKKPPASRPNPVMRDNYYRDLKTTRKAQSITDCPIAKNGLLPGLRADRQESMLEGSIDPANMRARRDPKTSLPNNYQEGAEGFEYQLRPSQQQSGNSVGLIQKARQSFYNHANMFQPRSTPVDQIPTQ